MDPYERADITSNTYYDWSSATRFWCADAGGGGAVRGDLQGVPAAPDAGELQRRQVMDLLGQPEGGSGVGTRALQ